MNGFCQESCRATQLPTTVANCPIWRLTLLRRAVAEKIFVQPHLGAVIARIEAAIHARLREDIDLRPNLRIEEQGQPRIQKKVVVGKDEAGSGLIDEIGLEIDESAQLQMKTVAADRSGKARHELFRESLRERRRGKSEPAKESAPATGRDGREWRS